MERRRRRLQCVDHSRRHRPFWRHSGTTTNRLGVIAFDDVEDSAGRKEIGEHEANADVPSLAERVRGLGDAAAEERVEARRGRVVRLSQGPNSVRT